MSVPLVESLSLCSELLGVLARFTFFLSDPPDPDFVVEDLFFLELLTFEAILGKGAIICHRTGF